METKRSKTSKITANSFQRQNRAIVNLQELSESPWHHPYEDLTPIQEPILQEKLNTNTHQSTELPLNPKQKHYESPIRSKLKSLSIDKPRPNTIQHNSNQPEESLEGLKNKKVQPLTSLNFYDDIKRSYNTFDDRSRLNEEIEMFASRIRQESRLYKSIEISRAKTTGLKEPNNNTSIAFKANVAKKSFFYKQFKNFLYSSFKVSGKPVQINRDKYSIESHGLPKKKSIYSFKEKNGNDFFSFNKTDVLRKKVGRYDLEGENEEAKEKMESVSKGKRKQSIFEEIDLSFISRSLHVRENLRDGKRRQQGKLMRGRPPTTLVYNEESI